MTGPASAGAPAAAAPCAGEQTGTTAPVGALAFFPDGRPNLLAHANIEDDDFDLTDVEAEPPPTGA